LESEKYEEMHNQVILIFSTKAST